MRPHDFDWRLRTKESHEEMGRFKLADQNARIKAIRREKCLPSIQNELDRIAEAMRLFEIAEAIPMRSKDPFRCLADLSTIG